MWIRDFKRKIMATLLLTSAVSCRLHRSGPAETPPDYQGQIIGPSFESGAPGFGQLTLLRMAARSSTGESVNGFARVDGSTRFVFAKAAQVDSTQIGLPGLQWSYVRVWYRGAPTSKTATEIWGNAALIRVDSLGRRPASGGAN